MTAWLINAARQRAARPYAAKSNAYHKRARRRLRQSLLARRT